MKSRDGRSPEGSFGLDPESKLTSALTRLGGPVFQIHTHFFFPLHLCLSSPTPAKPAVGNAKRSCFG